MAPSPLHLPGTRLEATTDTPVKAIPKDDRAYDLGIRPKFTFRDDTANDDSAIVDPISTPFASSTILHWPQQLTSETDAPIVEATPTIPASENVPIGGTSDLQASSSRSQISSTAVVGITLAFISVFLGLGAMMLARTKWYKAKMARFTIMGLRRQKIKNRARNLASTGEGFAPQEKTTPLKSILIKRGDSLNGRYATEVVQDEDIADTFKYCEEAQIMALISYAGLDDSGEDQDHSERSEESHSSQETRASDEEDQICSASSSTTSITSMSSSVEEEGEEEAGEVQRVQTQSVEMKRAVLITLAPRP